jgi:hypothetical protein
VTVNGPITRSDRVAKAQARNWKRCRSVGPTKATPAQWGIGRGSNPQQHLCRGDKGCGRGPSQLYQSKRGRPTATPAHAPHPPTRFDHYPLIEASPGRCVEGCEAMRRTDWLVACFNGASDRRPGSHFGPRYIPRGLVESRSKSSSVTMGGSRLGSPACGSLRRAWRCEQPLSASPASGERPVARSEALRDNPSRPILQACWNTRAPYRPP